MPVRTLVVRRPGELEQLGRTLRALATTAVATEDAGADLGKAITGAGGPVWLVRAGAWPAHPGPIPSPPPSATGRPLVAFGSVNGVLGEADPRGPASLYLEAEPAWDLDRKSV